MDFLTIPSTMTIAKCPCLTPDESTSWSEQSTSFSFRADPTDKEPEASIKEMLPSITSKVPEYPKHIGEDTSKIEKLRVGTRMVDFKEGYEYEKSKFG